MRIAGRVDRRHLECLVLKGMLADARFLFSILLWPILWNGLGASSGDGQKECAIRVDMF